MVANLISGLFGLVFFAFIAAIAVAIAVIVIKLVILAIPFFVGFAVVNGMFRFICG